MTKAFTLLGCNCSSQSMILILSAVILLLLSHCQRISATNVHIVYMGERKQQDPSRVEDSHHDMLAAVLGSKEAAKKSMLYSYKHGFSGFAARLTESQAKQIADEFPDVVRVMPNRLYKLHTTRSWDYLGLGTTSKNNTLSKTNMGDGIVIGVLDTGIWPESESFKDDGLGPVPSRWKGSCEGGELFNSTHCNKKLIGARWYMKGMVASLNKPLNTTQNFDYISPRDASGHGTHTSATAAGSFVGNVSYDGLARGTARGGAPRARLAMYKVCWNVGGWLCADADILKAFDEAIRDGVDVLSVSLGPSVPLESDVNESNGIAVGSFHAVARGVTVVVSAGNDGPSAQTVSAVAPWILSVAASNMDRAFPTTITLGNNKTVTGQGLFTGKEIGFTGLVIRRNCDAMSRNDSSYISGKVVLCFSFSSSMYGSTVKEAGGVGVIFAMNPANSVNSCVIPCIQVDYEIGTLIRFYIISSRSPQVKLSPSRTLIGKPAFTNVAYFSSRGPNSLAPAILKPDIAAPGVNVLAASSPNRSSRGSSFDLISGTSMACPHISGIVALIKSVHPDWSPAAIKSAIVTTASTTDDSGAPIFAEGSPRKLANHFDFGGGIANPNNAVNPGLVYDMGMADYIHYLCSMGYNNSAISGLTQHPTTCSNPRPSILDVNLPSVTIPHLRTSVTVTRAVTNVGPVNCVYNASIEAPSGVQVVVSPQVLVFNSTTKKLSFSMTFNSARNQGGYHFGSLTWRDGEHVVKSPLSVRNEMIPFDVDDSWNRY